jgi:hypothetical protein
LDEEKFDTRDNHTNGMHIHIDRKCFQKDTFQLKKFCFFFSNPGNTEFLKEISQRDQNSFIQYSNPRNATHALRAERALQAEKNNIVNLQHSATVEVRLFKGVVSLASIIKNLEFVDSIFEYSLKAGMRDMDLQSYLKWLSKLPKNQYVTLRCCINDMNLDEMLQKATIKSAVMLHSVRHLDVLLRNGNLEIPVELEAFFMATFMDKNAGAGWQIEKEGAVWNFKKVGTRFAKFDEQTFNMLQRNRLRAHQRTARAA